MSLLASWWLDLLLHPSHPSLAVLLPLSICLWCHPPLPVSCVCCHTATRACATALWLCPQLPLPMVSSPTAYGQHTPGDEVAASWVFSVLCAPESAGITCRNYPCLSGQLVTILHCPETLQPVDVPSLDHS